LTFTKIVLSYKTLKRLSKWGFKMSKIFFTHGNGTVTGTSGDDDITVIQLDNATIVGGLGDDILTVQNGNGTIYGDFGNASAVVPVKFIVDNFGAPGPFASHSFTTNASITQFGNDVINAGNGNVNIYGDTGTFDLYVDFQTASNSTPFTIVSKFFNFTQQTQYFGNDTITAGNGNDVIFGDADAAEIHALSTNGVSSIASGSGAASTAIFWTTNNLFVFGNDHIDVGNGNNVIYGDTSAQNFDPGGGVAEATNGGHATSRFLTAGDVLHYGNDVINVGTGDNIVYGEGQYIAHKTVGGDAIADGAGSIAQVFDRVGPVPGLGLNNPVSTIMGNDIITSGTGKDVLFGDVEYYINSLTGGTATATNGGVASSSFVIDGTQVVYGNDKISGGNGGDIMVGDALTTTISVTSGNAVTDNSPGSSATVQANIINFAQIAGDDIIMGGTGNDTIVGDMLNFSLLDSTLSSSIVSGHVQVADHENNTIKFGNDVLSGGGGLNNFVTTLLINDQNKLVSQGFDKITDFNVAKDTLTFVGVNDMATLNSHTTLTHINDGTIINFDGGGSITLDHVNVNSLSSLHVTPTPTLVIV
jgi:Ca2+-binding RTX toxin-like protein